MEKDMHELLKSLPKIDDILRVVEKDPLAGGTPREYVVRLCREAVEEMRERIRRDGGAGASPSAEEAARRVSVRLAALARVSLRKVVNATGIVLHTNLGRAPLGAEAMERVLSVARGYSNLEFNLEDGARGLRYDHVRPLLCVLTGAEDALVVNNNAAAVLLVLNSLAQGREALVSRGELVEIGGEFRIPEVMEKSGAVLREVGTTNRTHLSDYERAVGDRTGMILKVHTSNFRIVGFTEEVPLSELVRLGRERGVPVMNDLGSGCFVDLGKYGVSGEPTVRDAVAAGTDIVTFSGDKLLGGPQAGIIVGKRSFLQKVAKNPLTRALRIDKLTLAALEGTLRLYLDPAKGLLSLPVYRALLEPRDRVEKKAKDLMKSLRPLKKAFTVTLRSGVSLAGGGSLPAEEVDTVLVAVRPKVLSAARLGKRLRMLEIPVIARVSQEEILLDLRTVEEGELVHIASGLAEIAAERESGGREPLG
jgi:L-seryl-tRNA(Ser) seleniumtransferase